MQVESRHYSHAQKVKFGLNGMKVASENSEMYMYCSVQYASPVTRRKISPIKKKQRWGSCPQVSTHIHNSYAIYMLCAKFGSEQSKDCPAQTLDLSFVWTIRRLAMYSPTHYFLCGTCMLMEPWRIVAVKQRTKILTKKDRSKFLSRESVCIKSMYMYRTR